MRVEQGASFDKKTIFTSRIAAQIQKPTKQ